MGIGIELDESERRVYKKAVISQVRDSNGRVLMMRMMLDDRDGGWKWIERERERASQLFGLLLSVMEASMHAKQSTRKQ